MKLSGFFIELSLHAPETHMILEKQNNDQEENEHQDLPSGSVPPNSIVIKKNILFKKKRYLLKTRKKDAEIGLHAKMKNAFITIQQSKYFYPKHNWFEIC